MFTIDAGKKINVTMVAWLEGTHPHAADYCGWELRVELEIETNVNDSGWKVLGDLQEYRTISNIRYWHYYAIRGNGYSYVVHVDSPGSASFKKWLSPCIGYWGTEAGPVGSSSETVEPTTAPQGGGQSSSSSISNLVIKLDIPDGGTFSGNWYREDLSAHNYSMYAIFSNDNGSTEWRVQMTTAGDCSSVSLSDFSDSKFSTSTKLVGFIPVNGNDQTEKKRVGITAWSLQSNYNKNYRLTSDSWAN